MTATIYVQRPALDLDALLDSLSIEVAESCTDVPGGPLDYLLAESLLDSSHYYERDSARADVLRALTDY
jgi:hypothetical protein